MFTPPGEEEEPHYDLSVVALLGNVQLHDSGGHHVPAHLGAFHNLNQPPPRRVQESVDFCGTFTNQRGRADVFRRGGGWAGGEREIFFTLYSVFVLQKTTVAEAVVGIPLTEE